MTDTRLLPVLEPDVADRRQTEGAGGNLPRVTTEPPPCTCSDRGDPDWNGAHEISCTWLRWKLLSNEVVVFTEGDFETIVQMPTKEQADAYSLGVMAGASFYGAGSCTAYVMPYEADDMRKEEDDSQVRRALAALDSHRSKRSVIP